MIEQIRSTTAKTENFIPMKSQYYSGHLHNHLDPSSRLSDEEFGQMRSDYENEGKDGAKQGKFARGAGLIILLLAVLFVVQRFVYPVGPDLTSVLRMIPATGVILVLVIGFGLLTRSRSERRKAAASEWRLKNEVATLGGTESYAGSETRSHAGPDTGTENAEESTPGSGKTTSRKTSGKRHAGDPGDDPYGYEMHRKWYRSREEKMIFGVCGGIAERLDMDPTIVRALFALAFLSYGFSLVIYILLAVVLPKKPQHSLL